MKTHNLGLGTSIIISWHRPTEFVSWVCYLNFFNKTHTPFESFWEKNISLCLDKENLGKMILSTHMFKESTWS